MADSSWMFDPNPGDTQQSPGGSSSTRPEEPSTPAHSLSALRIAQLQNDLAPSDSRLAAGNRIRRRNRHITSCLECRRRKLKCDKQAPCTNCTRFKRDCLYLAPASDPQSQQRLAAMKEKMGALEKNLQREAAGSGAKGHAGGANVSKPTATGDLHARLYDREEDEGVQDEEALEPTPLAALDNVYEENADDELMDLGVQMGKMRISERVGGWLRPKLVEELNDTLLDVTADGASQTATNPRERPQPTHKLQASPKSYIGPGPDYIAPASSFYFPGTNVNTTLLDYLPSKNAADLLMVQYFKAFHPIATISHRPSLEAQYRTFWTSVSLGNEPAASLQAIVFAVLFGAAVSMTDDQVFQQFGTTKAALVDSLRSGTEMALSKANFLRTTRLDTMQAFVMYLIPIIRAEVSRAHSALVGTAIRLAECMGLHRDGSNYAMSAIEIHVRRLIWHQLCFLDMRTCDSTGPRPQIRQDDYDTRHPLNVDEIDLVNETVSPMEDSPHWTDMTLFRIRSELTEMRRALWHDVVQIDKKKKSLTSTLVKIQRNRQNMYDKYLPMIDESVPEQKLGKYLLEMGVCGWFIGVLHRYLFSAAQRMPDRLRQILIEAGLKQMESSIAMETKPDLTPWFWYRGALQQYHVALLLMIEVYAYPMRKDAAKIWKCLDFIFDIPSHLSPKEKAELVITDLRDRMEVYHQMRKLRVTHQMEQRVSNLGRATSSTPPVKSEEPSTNATTPSSGFPLSALQQARANGQLEPASQMGISPSIWSMPPQQFSPPPPIPSDGSRQGSVPAVSAAGADTLMQMEDIDWGEFDKYFPIQHNTGELNQADFNMASFTQGFDGQQQQQQQHQQTGPSGAGVGSDLPTEDDLASMDFGGASTFFAPPKPKGQGDHTYNYL